VGVENESSERVKVQAMYRTESMKVLLAEDEKKVSHFIRKALREVGYEVETVYDGNQAMEQAGKQTFDVIILDIMMPGRDGLAVLRRLREERNATPVMLLTARGEVSQRVEGLELGADDYLAKPFSMRELVARVNALSRRSSGDRATTLRVADLSMNLLTREVTRGSQKIDLAVREFALLEFLMRYPGRVLSRTSICEQVWDYHFDTGTNVVDVYINRLRRKIDDFHEVKLLQTVRGVGYILKGPE
jgi:two-component system, OmpR family, response regulator